MKIFLSFICFSSIILGGQLGFAQYDPPPQYGPPQLVPPQHGQPSYGPPQYPSPYPPPPSPYPQPQDPPPQYGPPQSSGPTVTIYRLVKGWDHMLSQDAYEGTRYGYRPEGIAFKLFAYAGPDTIPLFRCLIPSSGGHFASSDEYCEGQQQERFLGFMEYQQSPSAPLAIYRCYNGRDHLITTNVRECYNNRYSVEQILGYGSRR